jgi:uncharacterized protein
MLLDKLIIFVKALFQHLAAVPGVELRFTPDTAQPEISPWLRPGWQARAQGEGDLGARLQRAFAESFAAGAKRVAILGSDCPEVEAADIQQVWKELDAHDLVVGPATDGGYWLVGLKQPQPALFDGIAWSSERVLGQTLQHAKSAALRVQLLRILTDVDTEKEWREFLAATLR